MNNLEIAKQFPRVLLFKNLSLDEIEDLLTHPEISNENKLVLVNHPNITTEFIFNSLNKCFGSNYKLHNKYTRSFCILLCRNLQLKSDDLSNIYDNYGLTSVCYNENCDSILLGRLLDTDSIYAGDEILEAVLTHKNLTEDQIKEYWKDENLRSKLLLNQNLPLSLIKETLEILSANQRNPKYGYNFYLASPLLSLKNCPTSFIKDLFNTYKSEDLESILTINYLKNPKVRKTFIKSLENSKNFKFLVYYPQASTSTLTKIYFEYPLRYNVLMHQNCPLSLLVLELFGGNKNSVFNSPNCTKEIYKLYEISEA